MLMGEWIGQNTSRSLWDKSKAISFLLPHQLSDLPLKKKKKRITLPTNRKQCNVALTFKKKSSILFALVPPKLPTSQIMLNS